MPNWLIYLLSAAIILLQAFLLKRRWGKMHGRQRLIHLGLIAGVIGWVLIFSAEIEFASRTTTTADFQAHHPENRGENALGNNVKRAMELAKEYQEKDYDRRIPELEAEAKSRGWNVRQGASNERYVRFLEKLLTTGVVDTHGITVVADYTFDV